MLEHHPFHKWNLSGATMKAKKKISVKKTEKLAQSTTAKFPYTTKPSSLRRLLKEIPRKPKPTKFDQTLIRSWGFGDTNDMTMLRVLKGVNLLNDRNEPSEIYARFMSVDEGGKVLGPEIERLYAPLFQASHTPFTESNEKLQNLFNIHSGGGDRTLDYQIQTFKALCENASFEALDPAASSINQATSGSVLQGSTPFGPMANQAPIVNINLHIHLPENKSRRDYEDIIEDIGRYIFGRSQSNARE